MRGCLLLLRLLPSLRRGAVSQFAPCRRGALCVALLNMLCSLAAELCWGQWKKSNFQGREETVTVLPG